jgi:hypothetical protein
LQIKKRFRKVSEKEQVKKSLSKEFGKLQIDENSRLGSQGNQENSYDDATASNEDSSSLLSKRVRKNRD